MATRAEEREQEELTRRAQMLEAFNLYRISTLIEVLDRPQTFAFINGLVISSYARVISADPSGVVLEVDRAQLGAVERTRTLLLESPLHGATYRATAAEVFHRRAHVLVTDLEPFAAYLERRAEGRAAPAIPLLARLTCGSDEATGRVVDLSIRSLAADFELRSLSPLLSASSLQMDVWGEVDTASPLPDFATPAHVVRRAERDEYGVPACLAVLEFEPYPALERALRRFVARRQRDVLMELRLAGTGVVAPHACGVNGDASTSASRSARTASRSRIR